MNAKTLIAAVALAASLAVAPAMAAGTPHRADAIRHQIDNLQRDVNRNDNRDRISEREAAALRREVDSLQGQFRTFNQGGLDNREMVTLERRIQNIRGRLQVERHDRDHHRM